MKDKILVVFASSGDSPAYEPILKELDKKKLPYTFRICSCHRTLDVLQEILKENYSCIIAGAGLSAGLPGMIASQTLTPVIGVPIDGAFQGLDALLSILQMPPGFPVLTVGVNGSALAAKTAKRILQKYTEVTLVGNQGDAAVQKCKALLDQANVKATFSDSIAENTINIQFVLPEDTVYDNDALVLNVLPAAKTGADALKLLERSRQGVWIDRPDNAALAALQVLNKNTFVRDFRDQARQKVLDADAALRYFHSM